MTNTILIQKRSHIEELHSCGVSFFKCVSKLLNLRISTCSLPFTFNLLYNLRNADFDIQILIGKIP